jgi:hypothetical protein
VPTWWWLPRFWIYPGEIEQLRHQHTSGCALAVSGPGGSGWFSTCPARSELDLEGPSSWLLAKARRWRRTLSHDSQLPAAARRDLKRLVVVIAALLALVALTTFIVAPLVSGVLDAIADGLPDVFQT